MGVTRRAPISNHHQLNYINIYTSSCPPLSLFTGFILPPRRNYSPISDNPTFQHTLCEGWPKSERGNPLKTPITDEGSEVSPPQQDTLELQTRREPRQWGKVGVLLARDKGKFTNSRQCITPSLLSPLHTLSLHTQVWHRSKKTGQRHSLTTLMAFIPSVITFRWIRLNNRSRNSRVVYYFQPLLLGMSE